MPPHDLTWAVLMWMDMIWHTCITDWTRHDITGDEWSSDRWHDPTWLLHYMAWQAGYQMTWSTRQEMRGCPMTWHDGRWEFIRWHCMTVIWYEMARQNKAWLEMAWHCTSRQMTWQIMSWQLTWHIMTWQGMRLRGRLSDALGPLRIMTWHHDSRWDVSCHVVIGWPLISSLLSCHVIW